mmetsp:Transcript_120554/g.209868  ORF Transcript_120554/g.209868 Transcript_120554/m.209868 type:complete len:262 (+) Transcript_120554:475-1260(+)
MGGRWRGAEHTISTGDWENNFSGKVVPRLLVGALSFQPPFGTLTRRLAHSCVWVLGNHDGLSIRTLDPNLPETPNILLHIREPEMGRTAIQCEIHRKLVPWSQRSVNEPIWCCPLPIDHPFHQYVGLSINLCHTSILLFRGVGPQRERAFVGWRRWSRGGGWRSGGRRRCCRWSGGGCRRGSGGWSGGGGRRRWWWRGCGCGGRRWVAACLRHKHPVSRQPPARRLQCLISMHGATAMRIATLVWHAHDGLAHFRPKLEAS